MKTKTRNPRLRHILEHIQQNHSLPRDITMDERMEHYDKLYHYDDGLFILTTLGEMELEELQK